MALVLMNGDHKVFYTSLKGEPPLDFINDCRFELPPSVNLHSLLEFISDNNIDGVIHFASFVQSKQHKPSDVKKLVNTNVLFSSIVLEAAVQSGVKWFINTGTYWQHYKGVDYSPVNLYAATKQAFEDLAKYYIDSNLIKFVTVKLFDTFGHGDTRKKIFNIWKEISESGDPLKMSPGNQLIDISYIDDITNAYSILINILIENPSLIINGEQYFIKAKKRYSLKELVTIFEKVTCKKLNIKWGKKNYKHREILKPYDKGKTIPGYEPQLTVEAGLKKFLGVI